LGEVDELGSHKLVAHYLGPLEPLVQLLDLVVDLGDTARLVDVLPVEHPHVARTVIGSRREVVPESTTACTLDDLDWWTGWDGHLAASDRSMTRSNASLMPGRFANDPRSASHPTSPLYMCLIVV
jgi:hypothetical protein